MFWWCRWVRWWRFPITILFFTTCFRLFEGKRFDLGLYEAGSTRDVHFNKPGISYVFCNIHPEMSGVVVALDTPYYGISDSRGQVVIPDVPSGKYMLRVWHETALPETLKAMTREVTISETTSTLGVFRLAEVSAPAATRTFTGRITILPFRIILLTTGINDRPVQSVNRRLTIK